MRSYGVSEMEVNLDGLRAAATGCMNALADEIESIVEHLPDWKAEEVKEAYNDAARNVDLFNCVYDKENKSFNDISEKVEVRKFDDS